MFFKKLLNVILMLSCLSLVACQLPLNEDPPAKSINKIEGSDTQCLANVLPVIESYFEGTAKAAEVEDMWSCAQNALVTFSKNTQGANAEVYKAREIANFFETYFLGELRISDSFLTELMRFKVLFLGGKPDELSRIEIFETIDFFEKIKVLSVKLIPYIPILNGKWIENSSPQESIKEFEKANMALQQAVTEMSQLLEAKNQSYRLRDFVSFLKEAEKLWQGNWQFTKKVEMYWPVVESLKVALAGGDADLVRGGEWRRFLLIGSRGYIQYLRFDYFISKSSDQGDRIAYWSEAVRDFFSGLVDFLNQKPDSTLTRAEIKNVLDAFAKFSPVLKFSDEFIVQAMKLKAAFFGGSSEYWTSQDAELVGQKLKSVEGLTVRVLAETDWLSGAWVPPASDPKSEFKKHVAEFESISVDAATLFEQAYDLKDLISFVKEIEVLSGPSTTNAVSSALKLLITFKQLQFVDNTSVVQVKQMRGFFLELSRVYSQYLDLEYFPPADNSALISWVVGSLDWLNGLLVYRPTQELSSAELYDFILKLQEILPELSMTEKFWSEFLILKKSVIGGTEQAFNSDDIKSLQTKLPRIFSLVDKFYEVREFLLIKWQPSSSSPSKNIKEFKANEKAVLEFTQMIAAEFVETYDLAHMMDFIESLAKLFESDFEFKLYEPFVVTLKQILFSQQNTLMKPKQSQIYFEMLGTVYNRFLFFRYFIRDNGIFEPSTRPYLDRFIEDMVESLTLLNIYKKERALSYFELTKIVDLIYPHIDWPAWLTKDELYKLVKISVERIMLFPEQRIKYGLADNMSEHFIRAAREYWWQWSAVETALETLFKANRDYTQSEILSSWQEYWADLSHSAAGKRAALDLEYLLTNRLGLRWNSGGYLLFLKGEPQYSLQDLKDLNLFRWVSARAQSAYSEDLNSVKNNYGLNELELGALYKQMSPYLSMLGIELENPKEFIRKRTLEANLFMPQANGEPKLSPFELVNLIFYFGSTVSADKDWSAELKNQCAVQGGQWYADCVQPWLNNNYKGITSFWMPEMSSYFKKLDEDDKEDFISYVFTAAGLGKQFPIDELVGVPQILQYIEGLMLNYDISGDGKLQTEEALRAYPVFKKMLKELSGLETDKEVKALFAYIMRYGYAPGDIFDKIEFIWWRDHPESWNLKTDRLLLSRILSNLSASSRGEPQTIRP